MTPSDDPVLNLTPFDDDDDLPSDPPAETVAKLPAQLWARGRVTVTISNRRWPRPTSWWTTAGRS
jgi:hypothetical protein